MSETKTETEPVAAASAAPVELKAPKKVTQPDEAKHNKHIADLEKKIADLQKQSDAIRARMAELGAANQGDKGEAESLRGKLQAARSETSKKINAKKAIQAELEALAETQKAQLAKVKAMKDNLPYLSVDEIEKAIAALERKQQSTTMSIGEEKKLIAEIQTLNRAKPQVKVYHDHVEASRDGGVRKELLDRIKAANSEIDALKAAERQQAEALDQQRAKAQTNQPKISELKAETDEIWAQIKALKSQVRTDTNAYNKACYEWRQYQRELRAYRQQVSKKEFEERQAARKARAEERAAEDAEENPNGEGKEPKNTWAEEMAFCNTLIDYLSKLAGETVVKPIEIEGANVVAPQVEALKPRTVEAPVEGKGKDKVYVLKRKDEDDVECIGPPRKAKGKKAAAAAAAAPAAGAPKKLTGKLPMHNLNAFLTFQTIGVEPPVNYEDIPTVQQTLRDKLEYYATAPPKEKKDKNAKKEKAPSVLPTDKVIFTIKPVSGTEVAVSLKLA